MTLWSAYHAKFGVATTFTVSYITPSYITPMVWYPHFIFYSVMLSQTRLQTQPRASLRTFDMTRYSNTWWLVIRFSIVFVHINIYTVRAQGAVGQRKNRKDYYLWLRWSSIIGPPGPSVAATGGPPVVPLTIMVPLLKSCKSLVYMPCMHLWL